MKPSSSLPGSAPLTLEYSAQVVRHLSKMEIEKVDPRCLVAVREEVNAPWFSQRAVGQLAER